MCRRTAMHCGTVYRPALGCSRPRPRYHGLTRPPRLALAGAHHTATIRTPVGCSRNNRCSCIGYGAQQWCPHADHSATKRETLWRRFWLGLIIPDPVGIATHRRHALAQVPTAHEVSYTHVYLTLDAGRWEWESIEHLIRLYSTSILLKKYFCNSGLL